MASYVHARACVSARAMCVSTRAMCVMGAMVAMVAMMMIFTAPSTYISASLPGAACGHACSLKGRRTCRFPTRLGNTRRHADLCHHSLQGSVATSDALGKSASRIQQDYLPERSRSTPCRGGRAAGPSWPPLPATSLGPTRPFLRTQLARPSRTGSARPRGATCMENV